MHPQRIPAAAERLTTAHACLGRAIQDLRQARGLRQRQLAASVHVHPSYLHRLEAGEINPPFHLLLALAGALAVTLAELFAHHQRHVDAYPARPDGVLTA